MDNIDLSDIAKLRRAHGLYLRNEIDCYNKFFRFGYLGPQDVLTNTREYVFFTKPDLHLFQSGNPAYLNPEISNIPFFINAKDCYLEVLEHLQISTIGNKTPFMNLLFNNRKSSLELPRINTSIVETSATVYGTVIPYAHTSIEDDQGFDFSLEFEDTKEIEVYMLSRIVAEYNRRKDIITPPNDEYTIKKVLHDQFCGYKFLVGADGETIIYYAKLYGVLFKSSPRDSFGNLPEGGGLSHTIDFHAAFVEDMDPLILSDFNDLVSPFLPNTSDLEIYDDSISRVSGELATMPYIKYEKNHSAPLRCKLKWR